MWKGTVIAFIFGGAALGAPLVEVPEYYLVQMGPNTEQSVTVMDRSININNLTRASIIPGTACFNVFIKVGTKSIRQRVDCEEYLRVAKTPNYPIPFLEGYEWRGSSTYLYDTPSGDLEQGYYAESEKTIRISPARALLESTTPITEGVVEFDAITTPGDLYSGSQDSHSFSHTATTSGTVIVGNILVDLTNTEDTLVNTCSFNGIDMFYGAMVESSDNSRVHTYYLPNAPSGAHTLYCQLNNSDAGVPYDGSAPVVNVVGTDLHMPLDASGTGTGNSNTITINTTTLTDNTLIFDFAFSDETAAGDIIPGGDLHTELDETGTTYGNAVTGQAGLVTPAGATSSTWTWTGTEKWTVVSAAFKPPCSDTIGNYCTEVFYNVGTSTFTAPANVTSVDVACWGAGGAGDATLNAGTGGGGGGAYASTTGITVSAGSDYDVWVGTGGAGASGGNGSDGQRSHFFNDTTYSPIACGGLGATSVTGAAGGTTACSVGDTKYAGGAGGTGNNFGDTGGGGGGSSGPAGTGNNGSNGTSTVGGNGGVGNSGDVPGGTKSDVSIKASDGPGGIFGGGGGGGGDNGSPLGGKGSYGAGGGGTDFGVGGAGGSGMCHVSYIVPAAGGGGGGTTPSQSVFFFE